MTASEKAWSWCDRKGWHPHEKDSDDDDLNAIRQTLRRLQAYKLPLDAITDIEVLIMQHHEYLMKESGRRRVGQIPTHRVEELQGPGHANGHEYSCIPIPNNCQYSEVYAFSDLGEEWFRGWAAANESHRHTPQY